MELILLLRLIIGLLFVYYGYTKLVSKQAEKIEVFSRMKVPNPKFVVLSLGLVEVLAGMLLIINKYVSLASSALTAIIFVAIFIKLKSKGSLPASLSFYILIFICLGFLLYLSYAR